MSTRGSSPSADERRIARLLERLTVEYGEVVSFLEYRTPFELLIAVILSAQTTDRQVNRVTPRLFERFPTPDALASADPREVEAILHSIGFFRAKTRSILSTAREVSERFDGVVPDGMDALTSLPGVGRKSANVIRGTVFGLPAIIVDTHFGRVARRLGLATATDPAKVEREVAERVRPADHMRLSMLLNKHGRVYCHSRKPDCEACPIRAWCPVAKAGG